LRFAALLCAPYVVIKLQPPRRFQLSRHLRVGAHSQLLPFFSSSRLLNVIHLFLEFQSFLPEGKIQGNKPPSLFSDDMVMDATAAAEGKLSHGMSSMPPLLGKN
jgi:hypothetical protein